MSNQIPTKTGYTAIRIAAGAAVAFALGSMLAGCLAPNETPNSAAAAAGKSIDDAKAIQADTDQRAKEANDMVSTGH